MWARLITRLTIALLKEARLSVEDRALLTVSLIDKLKAFPTSDILYVDKDTRTLFFNGKKVDMESAIALREGARLILNSKVYQAVQEQVLYKATVIGINKALTPEDVLFAKAIIWWAQSQHEIFQELAQQSAGEEDTDI